LITNKAEESKNLCSKGGHEVRLYTNQRKSKSYGWGQPESEVSWQCNCELSREEGKHMGLRRPESKVWRCLYYIQNSS